MSASNISKGVLSVGLWTVTRVVVSILATPFISRALGTDGYGLYAYYLSVLFLAAPLANVGTLQALSRFIAERPDPARRARIALLSGLMSLTGFIVIGVLTGLIIAPGLPPPGWPLLAILLGCLGFDVLWFYARGILYGMHREEVAGLAGAVAAVLGSVVSALLAILGHGITGVFTGLLLGNAVMALASFRATRRLLPRSTVRDAMTSHDPPVRDVVSFTLQTMVYASFSMMLYRSGVVLVHHLTGDHTATGLFATALQMAEFVWVLIIAVEGVMLQTTARLWYEGKTAGLTDLVSRILRYASLVTAFLLVAVFVFAEDLLRLYFGPAFAGAAPVLRILIPGVFSFSLGRLLGPVLHARGGVLRLAAVVGSATLLNALLAFVCIPRWGVAGAGLSTAVAYGLVLVPYVLMLKRSGVEPFRGFRAGRQGMLVIVTAACMSLVALLPLGTFGRPMLGGIVGAVVFAAGALRSGIVPIAELEEIIASLPAALAVRAGALFGRVRPLMVRIAAPGGSGD